MFRDQAITSVVSAFLRVRCTACHDERLVAYSCKKRGFRLRAPTNDELTHLTHTIAHRVARYLERQGLLERDTGHTYLTFSMTWAKRLKRVFNIDIA